MRLKDLKFKSNYLNSAGFYTVEGAFTITIFAALFMLLLSLISIMRVESVVQYAINETVLELSQNAYTDNNEICLGGVNLCKTLTKCNFHRNDIDTWLRRQGIEGGFDGLIFNGSSVLQDGENISLVVVYKLNLGVFSNGNRTLTICQKAQTAAWLTSADKKVAQNVSDGTSIWKKDAFVRGKYFAREMKSQYPDASVKSGQGIDLYFKSSRVIAEVYSMNVFMPSYANISDDTDETNFSPQSYVANEVAIEEQLVKYAEKFNADIGKTERIIEMADGSLSNFGRLNEKQLIIVVPTETSEVDSFKKAFEKTGNQLLRERGVKLQVRYMEEAFV